MSISTFQRASRDNVLDELWATDLLTTGGELEGHPCQGTCARTGLETAGTISHPLNILAAWELLFYSVQFSSTPLFFKNALLA